MELHFIVLILFFLSPSIGVGRFFKILYHEGKETVNEMVNNYYHKQEEFLSFEDDISNTIKSVANLNKIMRIHGI